MSQYLVSTSKQGFFDTILSFWLSIPNKGCKQMSRFYSLVVGLLFLFDIANIVELSYYLLIIAIKKNILFKKALSLHRFINTLFLFVKYNVHYNISITDIRSNTQPSSRSVIRHQSLAKGRQVLYLWLRLLRMWFQCVASCS